MICDLYVLDECQVLRHVHRANWASRSPSLHLPVMPAVSLDPDDPDRVDTTPPCDVEFVYGGHLRIDETMDQWIYVADIRQQPAAASLLRKERRNDDTT